MEKTTEENEEIIEETEIKNKEEQVIEDESQFESNDIEAKKKKKKEKEKNKKKKEKQANKDSTSDNIPFKYKMSKRIIRVIALLAVSAMLLASAGTLIYYLVYYVFD